MTQPPTASYYAPAPGETVGGNGLAVASMVCGIVAVPTVFCAWFLSIPCALVAVSLGIVAIRRARRGLASGGGMAIAGLVCGLVSLAIDAVLVGGVIWFLVYGRKFLPVPPPVVTTPSVVTVTPSGGNAAAGTAQSALNALDVGLAKFRSDTGRLPTTGEGLAALARRPAGVAGWHGPYVVAPLVDPWGTAYVYRQPGSSGATYDLLSCGPDGTEGGGDDVLVNRVAGPH